MTTPIAFISKTTQFFDHACDLVAGTGYQVVSEDFSLIHGPQDHGYPVLLIDVSLLNEQKLAELTGFCTVMDHPPILVLSQQQFHEKDLIQIYDASVADVHTTDESVGVFQAKLRRLIATYQAQYRQAKNLRNTEEQNELLEFHATHDALTGVYNHLYFQQDLAEKFGRCQVENSSLGLFMFDIDFFKEVNDSYGHQVGDLVLKEFAHLVVDLIPDNAVWCRYGGEEFMLILEGMDGDELAQVGETIRRATEEFIFCADGPGLRITVSLGGTMVTSKVKDVSTLIEQADHALYQAKAMGRNCLIWYQYFNPVDHPFDPSDDVADVRDRLRATLEKTRASALASFEAMVHSQTKDHQTLEKRNKLAVQMVNLLCKRLNLPRNVSQSFRRAFKLHDLLRLFISDSTLQKTESLSEAERLAIEDQPLMLKQLTDLFDFFADERMILRYHHEYFDGSGYPEGLDGQDIPMGARLFAIVDAYVAMVLPSYDRPLKDPSAVIKEFSAMSGVQFDPFLVHLLIDIISDDAFICRGAEQVSKGSVHEGSCGETEDM